MKFSILLYFLYRMFKFASWKNKSFRDRLKEKNFIMVMKTRDGKRARSYTFTDGKVSSQSGDHPSPGFVMVWKDASAGFRVMAGGSTVEFTKAIRNDTLLLQDDAGILMWFMETMNRLKEI